MTKTNIGPDSPFKKEVFSAETFERARAKSFFMKHMDSGTGVIRKYRDFDSPEKKGDKITLYHNAEFDYRTYTTEGEDHEINSEGLTTFKDSMTLEQKIFSHRDNGSLTRKRPAFNLTREAMERLSRKLAELIDAASFAALQDILSTVKFGGSATSLATLTATDFLTPDLISDAKTFAIGQQTLLPGDQHSLGMVDFGGDEGYILVVSHDVFNDLKQDSDFHNRAVIAVKQMKGKNPIFDGGQLILHDGVLVMPHAKLFFASDGGAGANVKYARNLLLGKDSLAWAWGARPELISDMLNLKQERIDGYEMTYAVKKPVFNALDQGTMGVFTARTNKTANAIGGVLTI